jgi:hypothetical protein
MWLLMWWSIMGIRLGGNVDVVVKMAEYNGDLVGRQVDVAVNGAERGSKGLSIGRKVCKDKQRYHSTSVNDESKIPSDCEGRVLWAPCEPRGQQTTMDKVDIGGDGTSNVKVLIDTSHGAPQSFEFGHLW